MRNIAFDAFISDTLSLTRSMVIKIEEIALKDNAMLTNAGHSVSEDKSTWRYFMNMNGDYHETDIPMYVNSIDTGEEILFSKENLEIHLATAREYRSRGYWYKRLLELNPAQVDLIKGILSPIPYNISLEAENYKILDYDQNYVEANEYHLIPELQRRIIAEAHKTLNNDYLITEDLMLTVLLCNLMSTVFKAICNIRFNSIGTRNAHSFYIWSHIDSFGNFSRYKDSLNNYQTLWLYRNIHWLINHAGQNENFDYLLENLLTERNIPIAKFDMVLSSEDQETTFVPKVNFRRSNLNLLADYGTTPAYVPTATLIAKERFMAAENAVYEDEYLLEAKQLSEISLFSELPTKVLESSMMDTTNIHQDTRLTTLFNNWIYLTYKNIYRASILVTNPKTGQQFRINPGDAWHLWYYLVNAANGRPPLVVEPTYYSRALKINPPSIAQLRDIGGPTFIDNVLAKDIRNLTYSHGFIITPEKLLSTSEEIYAIMWKQRKLYSQFYDINKRARVKNAVSAMSESGFARITNFTSYYALLANYELDFTEWEPNELYNFAYNVFQASTAWGLVKVNSLGEIQSDLIGLMSDLSSYTIQIVKEIVEGGDTIEIPNENFVGRPLWTEGDFWDIGDFSGVQLDSRGYLTPWLDSKLAVSIIPDKPLVIKSITGDGVMDLFDGNYPIKVVEVDDQDWLVSSIRLVDNSYCYLRPADLPPEPNEPTVNQMIERFVGNLPTISDLEFISAPPNDPTYTDVVETLTPHLSISGLTVETMFEFGTYTSWPYPEIAVESFTGQLPSITGLVIRDVLVNKTVEEQPVLVSKSLTGLESREALIDRTYEDNLAVSKSLINLTSFEALIDKEYTDNLSVSKSLTGLYSGEDAVYIDDVETITGINLTISGLTITTV